MSKNAVSCMRPAYKVDRAMGKWKRNWFVILLALTLLPVCGPDGFESGQAAAAEQTGGLQSIDLYVFGLDETASGVLISLDSIRLL